MIFLIDRQDSDSADYLKILNKDIITAYCTFTGITETENSLTGEKGEEISLDIHYADLISE